MEGSAGGDDLGGWTLIDEPSKTVFFHHERVWSDHEGVSLKPNQVDSVISFLRSNELSGLDSDTVSGGGVKGSVTPE